MKKTILILAFFAITVNSFAQIPNGYYSTTTGLTGAALKTALYNKISSHTDVGYDGLYTAYSQTDVLPSGKIWDMYSLRADGTADYFYNPSGPRCGNYNGEADCFNREHSFCDSWLGKASPQRSDLFHVVPTDGYVNNRRNDFPHGKVKTATWTSSNGSKLGSSDPATGYSGTVFEPIDEFKGDFARQYFYVATAYENKVAAWANNGTANTILAGNSYPAFKTWYVNLLIQWHNLDPVSPKEIARNNAIYLIQHNRNPYIDHPEFVCMVWGPNAYCTSSTDDLTKNNDVRFYPNPVSDLLTLENHTKGTQISIVNLTGQVVSSTKTNDFKTEISVSELPKGIYFIKISENQKIIQISKFIKN
jgi:endonuclease I